MRCPRPLQIRVDLELRAARRIGGNSCHARSPSRAQVQRLSCGRLDKRVSPTMPPSKKAIPTKKDIDAPGLGDLPPSSFDPNIEHFKMIEASIKEIKAHPLFGPHIDLMDPLPLVPEDKNDLAGFLAPLDRQQMVLSRDSGSEYFCGVNLLWGNPLESITPGVPIMSKAVADLVKRLMTRGPKILEDRLEFVFPGPTEKTWRRCSPEECLECIQPRTWKEQLHTISPSRKRKPSQAKHAEAAACRHHGRPGENPHGCTGLRAAGMEEGDTILPRQLCAPRHGAGCLLLHDQQALQSRGRSPCHHPQDDPNDLRCVEFQGQHLQPVTHSA